MTVNIAELPNHKLTFKKGPKISVCNFEVENWSRPLEGHQQFNNIITDWTLRQWVLIERFWLNVLASKNFFSLWIRIKTNLCFLINLCVPLVYRLYSTVLYSVVKAQKDQWLWNILQRIDPSCPIYSKVVRFISLSLGQSCNQSIGK